MVFSYTGQAGIVKQLVLHSLHSTYMTVRTGFVMGWVFITISFFSWVMSARLYFCNVNFSINILNTKNIVQR